MKNCYRKVVSGFFDHFEYLASGPIIDGFHGTNVTYGNYALERIKSDTLAHNTLLL